MSTSTGTPPVAFYATFSGERDKGGTEPIDNVVGFDADGAIVVPSVLAGLPKDLHLHILRGMAFGPDGLFYVANAHKANSMILAFGAPDADGRRPMFGDKPFAHHGRKDVALIHPYGMVWDRMGHLLVTVQDTVVVTRFTPDRQIGPVADFLQEEFGHIEFLPGTHVASALDAHHLPPPVPVSRGGLHEPRGIAYCAKRHTIYVADEGVRAVRSYSAATGHFLGDVLTEPKHDGQPIGLLLDETEDRLFVGLKKANKVVAVDLDGGAVTTVAHHKKDGVVLEHPAGLALGADGALYVASQDTFQILRFDLDGGPADVFVDDLTDTPEHLIAVPAPIELPAAPTSPAG